MTRENLLGAEGKLALKMLNDGKKMKGKKIRTKMCDCRYGRNASHRLFTSFLSFCPPFFCQNLVEG
jgi:hypothetical protein